MTTNITPKRGDRFRHVIGDANVLFELVERDRNVWRARAVNEPITYGGRTIDSDHAGTVMEFPTSTVVQALRRAAAFERLMNDQDAFWDQVNVGDVLHYVNGSGQFVRGTVVTGEDGNKALKPEALVGTWKAYDLPRRDQFGDIHYGYQAAKIREGKAWTPNPSCIFEAGTKDQSVNPTDLPTLDLTLPEPTPEDQWRYARERLLRDIGRVALDVDMPAEERLSKVAAMMAEVRA